MTKKALCSWYGHESGSHTANGERFIPSGKTCAHKKLAFGTMVKFTNPKNGKSVTCRVNDRGPFTRGREFDLAHGAAKHIGMTGTQVLHYIIV